MGESTRADKCVYIVQKYKLKRNKQWHFCISHFTFQVPPFWSNGDCRRHIFSSSQKSNISRTSAIAASLGIVSSVKASSTSPKESSEFQSQQFSFSTSDIANIGSDNGIEAPEQPSTPQIGHRHHRRWCLCTKSLSGVEVSRLNAKKSIFYFQGYSGTFGIKVALKLVEQDALDCVIQEPVRLRDPVQGLLPLLALHLVRPRWPGTDGDSSMSTISLIFVLLFLILVLIFLITIVISGRALPFVLLLWREQPLGQPSAHLCCNPIFTFIKML